ncbi:TPA: hypothetical protein MCD02_005413 [Klebsiella pneumoniae]|nr:hypothetical protein [Klebsiella pneumoniae]
MQKSKRKLGFLRGKGSIPDQKQLEEMDQEVSSQFLGSVPAEGEMTP